MLGDRSLWDETQTTQELMKCVTFSSLLFLFLYLYKKANFQGKGVWGKKLLKNYSNLSVRRCMSVRNLHISLLCKTHMHMS